MLWIESPPFPTRARRGKLEAMPETFVIVGASLAGTTAAETLRAEGFEGRVLLIGEEERLPYERPPLSKGLLLGDADPFLHPESWYADQRIELRLGERVEELDLAAKRVHGVAYDKLLLATGSRPRRLPGDALSLRNYDDALRLKEIVSGGGRLTIIGSGWIGLEVAAAARQRDVAVTVITPETVPLQNVLGTKVGAVFADLHRAHGVDFRFGSGVEAITGTAVRLTGGSTVDGDHVLVAIGAAPDIELAARAGLAADAGVLVDAHHRTSDPSVFAAGDIASVDHPLYGTRIRVEHWANALDSGPAAARSMLGRGTPWTRIPYFFTDQYDLGMEYAGTLEPGAELIVRGDLAKRECIVFWVLDGRVTAGMNINVWDVTDQIQALITAGFTGHRVDVARLADPAVPLPDLLPGD
ncbi:ferredoxin [Actinoplanes sp. OR16]|uniref:NAD(P)/FAD-dependent oxidoreductase n=1 Tax=Actinoplanes sp. OR16 TaxID=946334 RepID=UPI000F6E0900|nr:FAD-dependent oxidoreductase [Actinoplanes sp. OR16]BBH69094.1 ferredoxin [Actinoplanes sp. OR16]